MSKPLRVLIVEDSEDDSALLLRELRRGGYDPTYERVETAKMMTAALDKHRWDLVISDYKMPQFDFSAALKVFQARQLDIPFILLSGTVGDDVAVAAMKAGVHDYLLKQNLARLVPAVDRELAEAAMRQSRREADKALHASEEQYRCLFQNSRDALMTLEPPSWRFTSGNLATVTMFKARDEEHFMSCRPWDLSPEKQPDGCPSEEKAREMIETAMREGSHFFEWTHRRINGEEFPTSVLLTRIELAGKRFLQATFRDITERKRSEEKLREMNEYLENLFNYANAPIIVWNPQFRITRFNRACETLTGRQAEDVVDRSLDILFPPAQVENSMELIKTTLGGERWETVEIAILRLDGSVRTALWSSATVFAADGKTPLAGIAQGQDITERKRAEDALREANIRIGKSLEELKLTQQKIIQQERLSALGEMASGIAHDFNNVLMPIIGFSELLMSDPHALDDRKETRHMIDMILSAGNDARQIVRRLRAVYRKDDDALYEMVDILRIVESAISLTMPKWKEEMNAKGVAIEMVTDFHPVPQIKGNSSEIREALTNLIFNATDAMPEGGVITFRVYCEDNVSVILEVIDTGLGMNEDTLQHCMEPFFTTKGVQGSGLGLAMVHGILERHGGTVEIESKPGAGATVRMRFSVPVGTERTEKQSKKKAKRLPPLRILVIDDETRSRDLIAKLLKKDGHYVEMAGGGREGLDVLRKGEFDLIFTDSAMPLMSGDEVAGKAQKIRPGIPIIMLTGFGDIMKDNGKCPAGIARVMSKPVTSAELRSGMASVLNAGFHQQNGHGGRRSG